MPNVTQRAFADFIRFAPKQQCINGLLMLAQSVSTGVGLLLLLPLLSVIGIGNNGESGVLSEFSQRLFTVGGIQPTLVSVLSFYCLVIAAVAATRYQLSVRSIALQQLFNSRLRLLLYRALLQSRWQYIASRKMSDFTTALTQQVTTVSDAAKNCLQILVQSCIAATLVMMVAILSWQMTAMAVALAILLAACLWPLNRLAKKIGGRRLRLTQRLFQQLTEQLHNLKLIKSSSGQTQAIEHLQTLSRSYEQQQVKTAQIQALSRAVYLCGGAMGFCLLFYYSQTQLNISTAESLVGLAILSRLLPALSALQLSLQKLLHSGPSIVSYYQQLDECLAAAEPQNQLPPLVAADSISATNISYRYPGQNADAISGISFTLPARSICAIAGPSGAGKSTLADIIAGMLSPSRGSLSCDGQVIEAESLNAWRRGVAYVPQESFLNHSSVRANLNSFLSTPASDQELWEALELAAAANVVRQLPAQLDTVIGDRGTQLSGGERQRLSLARALLQKPQLLILDEATNALDSANEALIASALKALKNELTIVIICHGGQLGQLAQQTIELNKTNAH